MRDDYWALAKNFADGKYDHVVIKHEGKHWHELPQWRGFYCPYHHEVVMNQAGKYVAMTVKRKSCYIYPRWRNRVHKFLYFWKLVLKYRFQP